MWNNEPVTCKSVSTGEIRLGDFIMVSGSLTKVMTVQKPCPFLDRQGSFTMITVETREGKILPIRETSGRVEIHRKAR